MEKQVKSKEEKPKEIPFSEVIIKAKDLTKEQKMRMLAILIETDYTEP